MARAFRFLLRQDLVIVEPVAGPAAVKAGYSAAYLRQAREMDFRGAVAAVSFAVRFSPEIGLFAVALFGLCRSPICFVTAGFGPASDPSGPSGPFGPAGSDLAVVAAVAAAVAAV